jgi:hypothetical protein
MARSIRIFTRLAPRRSGRTLADTMNIAQAIRRAERILPGREAPEGELDPRWQAIIGVAEHIQRHPDEVWRFTRKWGAHPNADLRMAVATCLLEHLLECHFERFFPLVSQGCRDSKRFADTFKSCWEFGQSTSRRDVKRFRALQKEVRGPSANKPLHRMAAQHGVSTTRGPQPGRHR